MGHRSRDLDQHDQQLGRIPRVVDEARFLTLANVVDLAFEGEELRVTLWLVRSPDVQPFVQAGVLRVADEVVEEEPDVRGHVVAGRHGVRGDIKDEPFGYRSEQGFLAREIGIQPFLAGVGFGRDAVDACAREAALGELRLGRNKDPLSSRFTS